MSSSEDDKPLAGKANNGQSSAKISKAVDAALDKEVVSNKLAPVGISIRNGPVTNDAMDIDHSTINGKRKARTSNVSKSYKDESASEDDAPLSKRPKSKKADPASDSDDAPLARRKSGGGKLPPKIDESSEDDDEPLGMKLSREKAAIEAKENKEAKAIRARESKAKKEESSDDDAPLAKKSKVAKKVQPKAAAKKKGVKVEDEEDTKVSIKKQPAKANGKTKAPVVKKGKATKPNEDEEEEEEYAWWNAEKREDDSIKWDTLQHQGVVFPPEYEALPKNVKLKYNGVPLTLSLRAEEIAGFFGAMLNSTHNVENPVFVKNFFNDFQASLKEFGAAKDKDGKKVDIKDFEKLDFQDIFAYYQGRIEERKARPAAEKKAEKKAKDDIEARYMHCTWDGRKEKVGNFRVEPPGLFRGRGEHPKTGRVKQRVSPEQITINIGEDAVVPTPPEGHKWRAIQHDHGATWLAMWQENINGAYKYVMLAANSTIKGQSDYKKFEKARELKKHIDIIRQDYEKDLKSPLTADRQRATAMYMIDKFSLRAGNEKDTDNEAETVGCCTLKYEHLTLVDPEVKANTIILKFLGKDSIEFHDELVVPAQIWKNFKVFKKHPKGPGDEIFDRLNTSQLNNHLASYMPGLTAKVFRTFNASFTMATLLNELEDSKTMTVPEKVKLYNDCNRKVAILCNHKRTVNANSHEAQMEKLGERIKVNKYQIWRSKQMMLDLDPTLKKESKKGEKYFSLESHGLDQDTVKEVQNVLAEELRVRVEKKFAKENENLASNGEKEMKATELTRRLEVVDDLAKKYKDENKKKKIVAEGSSPSVEKLEAAIEKLEAKAAVLALQAGEREDNKEVALGTSKINYIDPRLTVVFAKRFDVPIEKFFSKTLREKFNWAIKSVEDNDDWQF